jgi:hypothetical protein
MILIVIPGEQRMRSMRCEGREPRGLGTETSPWVPFPSRFALGRE